MAKKRKKAAKKKTFRKRSRTATGRFRSPGPRDEPVSDTHKPPRPRA